MRGAIWVGLAFAAGAVWTADPEAARGPRERHAAAVRQAREEFEAKAAKTSESYRGELTRLQEAATKAGKIDQAVALREAAREAEVRPTIAEWLKEKRRFRVWWGDEFFEFGPDGFSFQGRSSHTGVWTAAGHDTIHTWAPGSIGKGVPGTFTFTQDRSRALYVAGDGGTGVITAVR